MVQGVHGKSTSETPIKTSKKPSFMQRVKTFFAPNKQNTGLAALSNKEFNKTLGVDLSSAADDPLETEALALGPSKFTPLKNPQEAVQALGTYSNAVQSTAYFTHNYDPVEMMNQEYKV